MIIFDLNALADDSHRRHLIEAPEDLCYECYKLLTSKPPLDMQCTCGRWTLRWKLDQEAYNEACGWDKVVSPTQTIIQNMFGFDYYDNQEDVHIWAGRCESFRKKTEDWLDYQMIYYKNLKMRPIGDTRPKEKLFENWYDLHNVESPRNNVDFVFSSQAPTIAMFRRRGIFVFDCDQGESC